ncbi:GAF domain-containing sensor histidine kinase [Microbacterium rhizophilus]|uniref:GAF domain-containing sensor histidine kinase n=1 Tax=Microbacterium rhizophilus TaxID=3138934 RepID=UPI0031F0659F
MSDELGFAEVPRTELERTIAQLVQDAQRVLTTKSRMRALLAAYRSVTETLDLDDVLQRIVDAAVSLVDARSGAVAVFDDDGTVERIIRAREPEDAGAASVPLADALESGRPPRVERVERDPQAVGIASAEVDGTGFLALPIRAPRGAYGALYLSGRADGDFTHEDEELTSALAANAGVALENARLFEQARRRQRWSAALAEVSSALLSENIGDVTGVVLARVATLVGSDLACVILPLPGVGGADGDELLVHTARGVGSDPLEGRRYPRAGSLVDRALSSGRPVLAARSPAAISIEADMGPTMVIPVVVSGEPICALTLSRSRGGARFTNEDVDLAADFASQVGLAVELTQARADRQRLELADERARIARDLHDQVIQRLFGAGLSLQSLAARHPEAASGILDQVDAIDGAIAEIRTAVFALTARRSDEDASTRRRVLDVATELADALSSTPRLSFTGAVDLMVTEGLADDVVAVVRECLANAARHASADLVSVEVAVDDEAVTVTVTDDGIGLSAETGRRSGTANLADRASRRAGVFELGPGDDGGTRAFWRAPLSAPDSRSGAERRRA